MSLPDLYALLFFISFCICLMMGLHILLLHPRAPLNHLFFLVCLALAIWSFGFSLANSAESVGEAIRWRRFAAAGWTWVYCLFLHFTLILTGKRPQGLWKWLFPVMYLPGLVGMVIFSLSGSFSARQYQMTRTVAGWINTQPNNLWDWLFLAHYSTYVILMLSLIAAWGHPPRTTEREARTKPATRAARHAQGSQDATRRRLAHAFLIALLIVFLAGFLTDQIFNKIGRSPLPQTGPVTSLLAIGMFALASRRIGLRSAFVPQTASVPGQILNMERQARIYHVFSFIYAIGALLYFGVDKILGGRPTRELLPLTLSFLLMSLLSQVILRIRMRESRRQTCLLVILALTIPLVAFSTRDNAYMTLWATPFLFLLLSVVFNQTRFMIWIGISTIFTQIWIWILQPVTVGRTDAGDHVGRILLFLFAIWISFYVNRLYVSRLAENESQIRFQKMISGISADLARASDDNMEEIIQRLLRSSGALFEVEHVLYLPFGRYKNQPRLEWHAESRISLLNELPASFQEAFPWSMERMRKGLITSIPNAEKLPDEAHKEREFLTTHKILALLAVPVHGKDSIIGLLMYGATKAKRSWKPDHRSLLRILANLLSDVLTKVETERKVAYMAFYDVLTSLPNRALFGNRLDQAISHAARSSSFFAVILLDLDAFKTVNDSLGHDIGDELLRHVGSRLGHCMRKQDTVARFGGDEFLLLVEDIDRIDSLHAIAQKVVAAFEEPFALSGQEVYVTASAGVAVYPVDGEDTDSLTKHADLAMYEAKEKGKNGYAFCSEDIKEDVRGRMRLANNLYRAQDRGELLLHYQPLIDARTRKITGAEALIRWQHPELGLIPPGRFIPLAEKNGLIRPIGLWVLREACRQASAWRTRGHAPIRLCVNVSFEQLRDPEFARQVETTLQETRLPPDCLELEMTESIAVREEASVTYVLEALREMGVSLAIDDFGTEYSSLNRLKTLPIHRIKLDMVFSRTVAASGKDAAIARAVLQLARDLSLQVTAEGIETEEQFAFFRDNGCDELQGYYFSRPLLPVDMEALLQS